MNMMITDACKRMKMVALACCLALLAMIAWGVTANVHAQSPDPEGDYNPYVSNGLVGKTPGVPSTLLPAEFNGAGFVYFNFGNTGSDPLVVDPVGQMRLTLSLSRGIPDNADPLAALGGTGKDKFSWVYLSDSNSYQGTQIEIIEGDSEYSITIAYKVTVNTPPEATPQNGFNLNLTPPPYSNISNDRNDDSISAYTFVEARDYGDAPGTYGTAYHLIDVFSKNASNQFTRFFWLGPHIDAETVYLDSPDALGDDNDQTNGLNGVNADDEDGVTFSAMFAGEQATVVVQWTYHPDSASTTTQRSYAYLSAWIDWNGDGVFDDSDESREVISHRWDADEGEWLFNHRLRVNGTRDIVLTVPADAVTDRPIFARFRLSSLDKVSPNDPAPDGEVEDYRIQINIVTGAIGDRVWLDEDSDGVQDAGEAGIANVTVRLYASDGTTLVATTVTDSNGNYLFTGVAPGNYIVRVDPASMPAGLAANPTYDEDGTSTPHQSTVTMVGGETYLTADFGYNWSPKDDVDNGTGTGAIGDRVWIDADGDGRQDPEEVGLYNVPVTLYTAGPDGLFGTADDLEVATTTTDHNGNYIFDDLPAGAYVVVINGGTLPAGYTQTGDPDAFGTVCTVCDNRTTTPIILAPGDVYVNADFGYQPDAGTYGSIGDRIWLDANRNNSQDAGEPGLAGVSVALIKDLNGNGQWDAGEPIIATDITDASGHYLFTGLPITDGIGTDDYLVWVNDTHHVLGELTPTYDVRDGGSQGNPAAGLVTGLEISAVSNLTDSAVTDADFAYAPVGHDTNEGLIGDTIFHDRNASGTFDAGEGLEGVTVWLYAANGTTLLATTVTNENGQYFFGGLAAGTYVVKVDTTTLPGTGLTNTVDPDGGTPNQSTVSITAGGVNLLQDFGYVAPNPNTISGTIWEDSNADGTLDGTEPGRYEGVTVVLRDSDGNIVATTTTDANGNFSFTGLPDGTYTVDVTDKDNILNGLWKSTGPNPGVDNNSQIDPYTVTVSGGSINDTADFGYYVSAACVGNLVWLDENKDGFQDENETGIDGVIVQMVITWPNGATTTLSTVTGDNPNQPGTQQGWYSFCNLLLDEDYRIGSSTNAAQANQPAHIISINTTQPVLASVITTSVTGDDGIEAKLTLDDSNRHSGTVAVPEQGRADTIQKKAGDEKENASYDFGFKESPTAVTLLSFDVVPVDTTTLYITWSTASEENVLGFHLWRSDTGDRSQAIQVTAKLIEPEGSLLSGADYLFVDGQLQPDTQYYYWLQEIETNGQVTEFGPAIGRTLALPGEEPDTHNRLFLPFLNR
jgi:hypothetical protein